MMKCPLIPLFMITSACHKSAGTQIGVRNISNHRKVKSMHVKFLFSRLNEACIASA